MNKGPEQNALIWAATDRITSITGLKSSQESLGLVKDTNLSWILEIKKIAPNRALQSTRVFHTNVEQKQKRKHVKLKAKTRDVDIA